MKRLRPFSTVLEISFKADPKKAVGVFITTALDAIGIVAVSLGLKFVADGVTQADVDLALLGAGMLVGVLALGEVANWLAATWGVTLEEQTGFEIDRRLMELSSSIPGIEHHERPEFVKKMEILRQQRWQLSRVIGSVIGGVSAGVQLVAAALILVVIHPLLLTLPFFAIPSLLIARRSEGMRQKVHDETADGVRMATHLRDISLSAEAGKEVRVFGLAPEILRRFRSLWDLVIGKRRATEIRATAITTAGWLVFALGYAGTVWFVVMRATRGLATPGDVLLVLHLAGRVNQQVSTAVFTMNTMLRALKAVERYLWLKDYADDPRWYPDDPLPVPKSLNQGIEFRGVSFKYPGTEVEVLHDVNLFFPAGSTVALVGDNGVGKTTLVKLLCGFYRPDSGEILIDNIPLSRMNPKELSGSMASGFQDFVKFLLKARESIGVGDLSYIEQEEAILQALERAQAQDVLASLPEGLETQLGRVFSGVELSGGEWQKLALGRTMMRETPLLLILDEPTASLDAETEHALFQRYASTAKRIGPKNGAITLLISHRFSTVRMADLIVVIQEGRVAEVGSHEDLMSLGGSYQEIYELQARGYRPSGRPA